MAIRPGARFEFEHGAAWVQVFYDDRTLDLRRVEWVNGPRAAAVTVSQAAVSDAATVEAGSSGTKTVPRNRYTFSPDVDGDGLSPDFDWSVRFG